LNAKAVVEAGIICTNPEREYCEKFSCNQASIILITIAFIGHRRLINKDVEILPGDAPEKNPELEPKKKERPREGRSHVNTGRDD
jgi:hypothetical protein